MEKYRRKVARILYYARNIARDAAPQGLFRRRLASLLAEAGAHARDGIADRINYCNKLTGPLHEKEFRGTVASISRQGSLYYYDLKEYARYFPRSFRLNYRYGDLVEVPDRPSFVKSRPLGSDNAAAILVKLDKFRHFQFPGDPIPFADKQPRAVWRGINNNPLRVTLVEHHGNSPFADVAVSNRKGRGSGGVMHLSEQEQMAYRYIISIEGNDVATNTKWIFASNSVCMMPRPTVETWFMEGRLRPGEHFAEVRRDFADLEEKILHYEAHPDEARAIIANANAWAATFRDEKRERLVSLLVMAKYFVLTGQMEAGPDLAGLIAT